MTVSKTKASLYFMFVLVPRYRGSEWRFCQNSRGKKNCFQKSVRCSSLPFFPSKLPKLVPCFHFGRRQKRNEEPFFCGKMIVCARSQKKKKKIQIDHQARGWTHLRLDFCLFFPFVLSTYAVNMLYSSVQNMRLYYRIMKWGFIVKTINFKWQIQFLLPNFFNVFHTYKCKCYSTLFYSTVNVHADLTTCVCANVP